MSTCSLTADEIRKREHAATVPLLALVVSPDAAVDLTLDAVIGPPDDAIGYWRGAPVFVRSLDKAGE